MTIPNSDKQALANANDLFRKGSYEEARLIFMRLKEANYLYRKIAAFNISIIEKAIDSGGKFDRKIENTDAEIHNRSKVAVIFHVYHESTVTDILDALDNINCGFDLFITSPLPESAECIRLIFTRHPMAYYSHCVNRGRDILPFLSVYNKIINYDLCLKIHTKKGLTNFGDLWRDVSLQCLLKNNEFVNEIINRFEVDKSLEIAGPKDFYLSGRRLIHGNHQNLNNICSLLGVAYDESKDWAFFAGTMFWFRPSVFLHHAEKLKKLNFAKETGRQDGGLEHAIERIFGLLPSYKESNALLLSGYDKENKIELVRLPEKVGTDDPTKYLAEISKNKKIEIGISGDVNKQQSGALADMKVRGWLAKLDEKTPRGFVVRIGNQEFQGIAAIYRADLAEHGIHEGCHAFEVNVPLKFSDGNEHTVSLFDKESGLPIATGTYKWNKIKRSYTCFKEYLSWSYSGQYVSIPFVEEDKRAFAVMELIADELCVLSDKLSVKPLISIVMPTYNRASLIGRSINSVLAQKYQNWELLIVDDGGTDDTDSIVNGFKDSRIKFERLSANVGVSGARNSALQRCRGEYVAYLDSDNDWDARYLSSMVGAIKCKTKTAQAFYCGQIVFAGGHRELTGIRFGMFNKSLLSNHNFIDLNCFIHKRLISGRIPEFDQSLKRFVDWDFILKISHQTQIASIPVLLSNYYLDVAGNSLTANDSLLSHMDAIRDRIQLKRESIKKFAVESNALLNGVTIVIPSYESINDIEKCLESVYPYLDLKGGHKVELIIVDNKSSDEVLAFLRSSIRSRLGSVKLIELDRNYGFTYAVNCGIEAARQGNDVLLLNNDAVLTGDCLLKLQEPLYRDNGYGLSVPAQVLIGGTESICAHVPYALPEYDVDVNISVHHKNLINPPVFYEGGYFEIDFAPFFCVLIKADTLKVVPQLDVLNGRHYRSDRTYCEYVRTLTGLKVAYCPQSIVYHGLQKSTSALRELNRTGESVEFNLIFTQNTWSDLELEALNLKLPHWNSIF